MLFVVQYVVVLRFVFASEFLALLLLADLAQHVRTKLRRSNLTMYLALLELLAAAVYTPP